MVPFATSRKMRIANLANEAKKECRKVIYRGILRRGGCWVFVCVCVVGTKWLVFVLLGTRTALLLALTSFSGTKDLTEHHVSVQYTDS